MLELASALLPLLHAGETVAVVTITGVARSAPRGVGSAMAITRDARVIGAISGGCVESDAVALALATLARHATGGGCGAAARFGFSDERAFAAGLACGGEIDAVITVLCPDDEVALSALERAASGRQSAIGIVASGGSAGMLVEASDAAPPTHMLAGAYYGSDVLVVVQEPPPLLLLLGAGEHAAALCAVGAAAGFAVSVCDVWELLVTRDRFPAAAELVTGLPHEYLGGLDPETLDARTAVCILTHDVRLDVPAIATALRMPVGFVGAMGARSTVARRADLLRAHGVTAAELTRLHSPLGLDLGGATPEETALSVLAEIVAARHGATGRPLRDGAGALHPRSVADARASRVTVFAPAADSCAIVLPTP